MKNSAKTFQDLIVWQKAHKFVVEVYKHTKRFPKSELYGLASQFRRASVSIAANIAEGFKKTAKKIKSGFLILLKVHLKNAEIISFFLMLLNLEIRKS